MIAFWMVMGLLVIDFAVILLCARNPKAKFDLANMTVVCPYHHKNFITGEANNNPDWIEITRLCDVNRVYLNRVTQDIQRSGFDPFKPAS